MQKNCSRFFENRDCEYYPCHDMEQINCMFCFCPLYLMKDCGGAYLMIKDKNGGMIKDCSQCTLVHGKDGYKHVIRKITKSGM